MSELSADFQHESSITGAWRFGGSGTMQGDVSTLALLPAEVKSKPGQVREYSHLVLFILLLRYCRLL